MRSYEFISEAVGGNYLYHATDLTGAKGILSSGGVRAANGAQAATTAQTQLPTVSTTRDWNYATIPQANQANGIGREVVLILDRNAIISKFGTPIKTSQSEIQSGLPYAKPSKVQQANYAKKYDTDKSGHLNNDEVAAIGASGPAIKKKYFTSKTGKEFEEAIPVKGGVLPLQGILVGFWVNPNGNGITDAQLMNDPRRLDMTRPGVFTKATK
jgi:hypothetical protein